MLKLFFLFHMIIQECLAIQGEDELNMKQHSFLGMNTISDWVKSSILVGRECYMIIQERLAVQGEDELNMKQHSLLFR